MISENNGKKEVNYFKLGNTIRTAVRFLDNVIEMNKYPLPEIEKKKPLSFLDTARRLELDGPSDWSVRLEEYLCGINSR
jgi:hypothetical protein